MKEEKKNSIYYHLLLQGYKNSLCENSEALNKGFLHEDGRHSEGWRMYNTACGITLKKAKGDWMQGDL